MAKVKRRSKTQVQTPEVGVSDAETTSESLSGEPKTPRKRKKNEPGPRLVHGVGSVPASAYGFRLDKLESGVYAPQTIGEPDGSVKKEWIVGSLSLDNIRQHFGTGFYRVQFFREDRGGCGVREFEVREPRAEAPAAVETPPTVITPEYLKLKELEWRISAEREINIQRLEFAKEQAAQQRDFMDRIFETRAPKAAAPVLSEEQIQQRIEKESALRVELAEMRTEFRLMRENPSAPEGDDDDDDDPAQAAEGIAGMMQAVPAIMGSATRFLELTGLGPVVGNIGTLVVAPLIQRAVKRAAEEQEKEAEAKRKKKSDAAIGVRTAAPEGAPPPQTG